MEVTMGGPVYFEPFAAKLTAEGQKDLDQILQIVKGHRNIIEVRGHAGEEPLPADWTPDDAMKLSYARAEYVAGSLVKNGVDSRAIRIIAVGANEPAAKGVYDPEKRGLNRRVEIIIRESLIDDYVGQVPTDRVPTSAPVD
jgi:outer membrane protein OmpA-like peptidoglycan-associated protein